MGSFGSVLGAIAPVLTMGGMSGGLVGMAGQYMAQKNASDALRAQQDLIMRQLQERQKHGFEAVSARNALEMEKIAGDMEANKARRLNALKRAVARQKTLFSAQGLGAGDGGSREAVLLGLYDESDFEQREDDRYANLRKAALSQDLAEQRQRNLLEATQLAQQQNLTRILKG